MSKFLMGAAGLLIASSLFISSENDLEGSGPPPELATTKTVIYFGAGNCTACEKYESSYEAKFRQQVLDKGVRYVRQHAEDRVNLKHKGVYGTYTSTFRQASDMAGYVTAPTFAYVVNGEMVAADFSSWKKVAEAVAAD